jgi:hypothetical protein
MKSYLYRILLATGFAALVAVASGAEEPTTIKFSDPDKPGTLKINIGRGELNIQGADTTEISVRSDAKAVTSKPRKDGLRVISASSTFSLREKDNVVTLDATQDWGRGGGDFRITVPRSTSIIVQNSWGGGSITCTGISGDIDMNNMHGEIKLDDVSGGVVVGTMNGEIRASFREFKEGKPVSFTSMNGEVHLRLPVDARANLRLRTQNGSVMTDFDDSVLVTKTEAVAGIPRGRNAFTLKSPSGKVITAEVEEAIKEASRISATAVREALEAVKQGLDESRVDADEARRQIDEARRQMDRARAEVDKARAEADRARRDAEREQRNTARAGNRNNEAPAAVPAPPAAPSPAAAPAPVGPVPLPPKMAIPTISGGKLVTGTLNGGGPEISVSTMNGDVILRKLERK